jgi:hypothetical protein
MAEEEIFVGIDVSKAELVVAVRPSGERMTLANERAGIKRLVGRLGELKPQLVVVEATGGLQRQVVAGLRMAGIAVAAVNPSWVRNFAKGRGVRAKTDRKDAELLALFAEREQPQARPPADAETQALEALVMRREQLLEMLVAENDPRQLDLPRVASTKNVTPDNRRLSVLGGARGGLPSALLRVNGQVLFGCTPPSIIRDGSLPLFACRPSELAFLIKYPKSCLHDVV